MAKTVFGEQDAHRFREGTHTRLYELLGAHLGDKSCYFSVWAPNAASVGVMGEFNDWRSESAPLELDESTGVWHGFVPGVARGSMYKYHVHSKLNDYRVDKSDPFATYREVPPQTASRVWQLDYEWEDSVWMDSRGRTNARRLSAGRSVRS